MLELLELEVNTLRLMAFPFHHPYHLFLSYTLKGYAGRLHYPLLRQEMFNREPEAEGYLEGDTIKRTRLLMRYKRPIREVVDVRAYTRP